MVSITFLFLVTIFPFCVVFASAAFKTPESTKLLDLTFFIPQLNGIIQPIVYILWFEDLRAVLLKVIRCKRPDEGGRIAMLLAIFRTTRSLSRSLVDNKTGGRSAAKQSIVSQVTIVSDSFEAADTSQPNCSPENSQPLSPLIELSELPVKSTNDSDE